MRTQISIGVRPYRGISVGFLDSEGRGKCHYTGSGKEESYDVPLRVFEVGLLLQVTCCRDPLE